jgi:hypothetical protein
MQTTLSACEPIALFATSCQFNGCWSSVKDLPPSRFARRGEVAGVWAGDGAATEFSYDFSTTRRTAGVGLA